MARKHEIKLFSPDGSVNKEFKFAPVETYYLAVEVSESEKLTGIGDITMYSLLKSCSYGLYIGKRYSDNDAPESLVITNISWTKTKEMAKTESDMTNGYPALFYKVTVNYTDDPDTAFKTKTSAQKTDPKNDNKLISWNVDTQLVETLSGSCYKSIVENKDEEEEEAVVDDTTVPPSVPMLNTAGDPYTSISYNKTWLIYSFTVQYKAGKNWDTSLVGQYNNSINNQPILICGKPAETGRCWLMSLSEKSVVNSEGTVDTNVAYKIAYDTLEPHIHRERSSGRNALDGNGNPYPILNKDIMSNPFEDENEVRNADENVQYPQKLAEDGTLVVGNCVEALAEQATIKFRLKPYKDWSNLGIPTHFIVETEKDTTIGDS